MKYVIILFLFFQLGLSQDNSIFAEAEKKEDKLKTIYPDWVINTGAGYIFHEGNDFRTQSNDFRAVEFKNNPHFYININRYFFQGVYIMLSATVSQTEETLTPSFDSQDPNLVISNKFTYISPYLGFNYYIRSDRNFTSPWFLSFGLGENIFTGSSGANFSRFSVLFKAGKILDVNVMSGKLTFDVSTLVHEDRGLRQYYIDTQIGAIPRAIPDFVTFVSFRLSVGLTFDILEL